MSPGPPPQIHLAGNPDQASEGQEPPLPAGQDENPDVVPRNPPDPDPARKQLVEKWASRVRCAKKKWDSAFKKMVRDQKFCGGAQWPEETKSETFNDAFNDRYIANITLRHVKQRVAAVYAKNPKIVAKVRPRLLATVWDGTMQGLQEAQQTVQQAQQAQEAQQKLALGVGLGITAARMGIPLGGAPAGPPPAEEARRVRQALRAVQAARWRLWPANPSFPGKIPARGPLRALPALPIPPRASCPCFSPRLDSRRSFRRLKGRPRTN